MRVTYPTARVETLLVGSSRTLTVLRFIIPFLLGGFTLLLLRSFVDYSHMVFNPSQLACKPDPMNQTSQTNASDDKWMRERERDPFNSSAYPMNQTNQTNASDDKWMRERDPFNSSACPLMPGGRKLDCGLGPIKKPLTAIASDLGGDLCFFGDSLARQMYVELACRIGTNHSFEERQTGSGFTYRLPKESQVAGDDRYKIRYHFYHFREEAVGKEVRSLRLKNCSVILISKGIWHVVNPTQKLDVETYIAELRLLSRELRREAPSAVVVFKDLMSTVYNVQEDVRKICNGTSGTSDDELLQAEVALNREMERNPKSPNRIVMAFNHGLSAVALSENNMSVLDTYQVTHMNPCDHLSSSLFGRDAWGDPIHFCQNSLALYLSVDRFLKMLSRGGQA